MPSLIPLLQENIEPLRYIAALLIVNIAPRKEYVPILLEILSKETAQNDIESEHTIDALERIHSKEALSVYIESWKFEDKRERYIIHDISHECIYNFLDVPELYPLLIQSLKNENIRFSVINSILKYSFFKEEKQLINSKLINIVIPRLITILENKYEGNPALKEIFVFKDRDIRRSAAYALGEIANSSADEESVIIKDTKNKQKIINALMAVVQNQKDDLDVRWMTATSLQKIGINQDSFFTKYALVNPKTIRLQNKSPTPSFRFDRYSSNYYYSVEYGCGNGLGEIYSELRRRLSRRNSSN